MRVWLAVRELRGPSHARLMHSPLSHRTCRRGKIPLTGHSLTPKVLRYSNMDNIFEEINDIHFFSTVFDLAIQSMCF